VYDLGDPEELDRGPEQDAVRIAVLLNHPDAYTGSMVASYLESTGAEVHTFLAYDGELPDPDEFDGIVGSGAPYSVHGNDPWKEAEAQLYLTTDRPVLGICFSHQLMAEAYGGVSGKAPGYDLERGPTTIHLNGHDPLFKGLAEDITMAEHHVDEVLAVPEDFEVMAYSDNCGVEAMRHRTRPVYSVQFHPEWAAQLEKEGMENQDGNMLLDNFMDMAREARVRREASGLAKVGFAIGDYFRHLFGDR
jgi:GMP synthase-like glutamine amidotransferase